MTSGETVLKFTDYPFAYSVVILIGSIFGFGLSQNKYLLLGIAGAFGTFLTVVDPIGWGVKARLEQRIGKKDDMKRIKICSWISKIKTKLKSKKSDRIDLKSNEIEPTVENKKSSIHSRAVGIEIDKIIGLIYFLTTVILFLAVMIIPTSTLADALIIHDKTGKNILLDSTDVRNYSILGSLLIMGFLGFIGLKRWRELDEKVETEGIHQLAIGNEFATENSVEKMTGAIDLGDWITAKEWAKKITKEIEQKKGKRDLIIKSSETVYEPLYKELIRIESIPLRQVELAKEYFSLGFKEWDTIKGDLKHLSVTDSEFVKLAESFQKETNRYDNLINRTKEITTEIILKHLTSIYGENVINVSYEVKGPTYIGDIKIQDLAQHSIFGSPPDTAFPNAIPEKLTLTLKDPIHPPNPKIMTGTELDKFLNDWDSIVHDVKSQDLVKQLDASYLKILKDVEILKEKCKIQNKLKYEVF